MGKMMYATLTLFCLFISRTSGSTFEGCTKQNTYEYKYVKMYPVDSLKNQFNWLPFIFRLEFHVKAASNAHILLSEDEDQPYGRSYEIVIGGGQNSFSQIRLKGKGNKAAQPTPNIMSPIEFKKFWIEVRKGRLIRVGEIGKSEPFLFWVGPDVRFTVKYFSFATWNNIKGEWYFDCEEKSSQDPESTEGETNVTDIQRLKIDLLTFLNPTIFPHREGYPAETIDVYLEATYFFLDEKRGELTVSGTAFLKWVDKKLTWEPASYGGLKYMYVNPFQIWTPTIQVLNSLAFEERSLLVPSGTVIVNNMGEIFWRVPFHSVTQCQLGYENWPFDVHNCTLVFGFLIEPLEINVEDMSVLRVSKSEWEIQKIDGEDAFISHEYFVSLVDISFRRREPSYEFLLLPPYLGAAVLALTSFWCRPNSSIKLFLNCGSILILLLVLMSIGERIANTVTATPKIVLLYSWSVLIMCVPIVLYVGLKYVLPYIHLPRWLSSILNSSLIQILFFLPNNSELDLNYSNLREQKAQAITRVQLITLIERFLFLIYFGIVIVPFIAFLTKFEMITF